MKPKTAKQEKNQWNKNLILQKKINKIDKPLTRLTKIKREKTQITNIRNKIEDISTDSVASKRIQEYCKLYTQKFYNLEEAWNSLAVSYKAKYILPCDSAIALLGIHPREIKSYVHTQKIMCS